MIPDDSPDSVLVRDVVLSEHGVCLLLVELHADVPSIVAVDLVELAGVGAVYANEALEVRSDDISLLINKIILHFPPWDRTLDREVSVYWLIFSIINGLRCTGLTLALAQAQTLIQKLNLTKILSSRKNLLIFAS